MTTDPDSASPSAAATATAPEHAPPASASHRRAGSDPKRWIAFGSGVGIEIRDRDLYVVIARVRPSGAAVCGALTLPDFRTRPAAEWGKQVLDFLRRNAAGHIAATVLLPRRDVIVRQIPLPGVSDRDLPSAVRLQMDSLHPFADDEPYFSWSRLGKTPAVLVAITRRETLEFWSTLFSEAGIKVASFTFSASVLYSAARLLTVPPASFITAEEGDDGIEVYGESPSRPMFSATLPAPKPRALAIAQSELRVDAEALSLQVTDLLPAPRRTPARLDPASPEFERFALAWAAALAGACPWLAIDGNLLPAELRRASSRRRLIPTIALASLLAIVLVLLALESKWSDARYLALLQAEINRYEPHSRKVAAIDQAIASTRARSQSLDDFRRRAKLDMDALSEVTKLIPPPGWVSNLDMNREIVQIAGETEQAAALLETLDKSPLFTRSEFTMPISRSQTSDLFRVRTAREYQPAPPQAGASR